MSPVGTACVPMNETGRFVLAHGLPEVGRSSPSRPGGHKPPMSVTLIQVAIVGLTVLIALLVGHLVRDNAVRHSQDFSSSGNDDAARP